MSLVNCRNVVDVALFVFTKFPSPEEHYFRLLQLYMPWRNENELKQKNQSYEDRYKEVEGNILCNIKKEEHYLDIDHKNCKTSTFFNQMKKIMQNFQW